MITPNKNLTRIYYEQPIQLQQNIIINKANQYYNYLINVKRYQPQQQIILFNQDANAIGIITTVSNTEISIHIQELFTQTINKIPINIGQAICNIKQLELITQKITELGATTLWLLQTEHNHHLKHLLNHNKLNRLNSISHAACMQSGNNQPLLITPHQALTTWLEQHPVGLILDNKYSKNTSIDINQLQLNKNINILIGPEAGFSQTEITNIQNNYQYQALNLGPNILKAETATISICSIINYLLLN